MRPERLTLRGFGVFRSLTEIDFSGVELFALTGPTGSGKTTVLDGICFSLYGSVPRHGKGAVAPVISQGMMEATVALTFSIGPEVYQVARRLKKDAKGKGAKVAEASLERVTNQGNEVLATAGQINDRVEALLGLDFDQFTTCVLLPQGEFARFLRDKPSDRQNLLTALLDLGIYDRLSQLALVRQQTAEGRIGMIEARLGQLGDLNEGDLIAARQQEASLQKLLAWLEETLPDVVALDREAAELEAEAERSEVMLAALGSLQAPADLERVQVDTARIRVEETEAGAEHDSAQSEAGELLNLSSSLPTRLQIRRWMDAYTELGEARSSVEPAGQTAAESQKLVKKAAAATAAAQVAVEKAADRNRAAHLRRGLRPGDPCPVCGQVITEVAEEHPAEDVARAEEALATARSDEEQTRRTHLEAESRVKQLGDRIADLTRQLEEVDDPSQLTDVAARVESQDEAVKAARARLATAKARLDEAIDRRQQTAGREAAIRQSLQGAWLKAAQAGLDPPLFEIDDPFGSWKDLGQWRDATRPRIVELAHKARARLEEVRQQRKVVAASITSRLEVVGLAAPLTKARDTVVDELTNARTRRETVQAALDELVSVSAELDAASHQQRIARQLSLELRADHFKQWLFDEVFTALVAGANLRLGDLTRGQYQMVLEGRDFEVIDHLSAGNRRSTRTLSGGETFLVSLALALALADQVAEAALGEARLDSFFLDEGFGTLDAESLEVVAGVIGDLGASGKTVGIVTHVAELAEQMPVRYEVRKSPDGATVEEIRL